MPDLKIELGKEKKDRKKIEKRQKDILKNHKGREKYQ